MFKSILRVLLVVITKQAKQRGNTMITKTMYMSATGKENHHNYHAQFVTEQTKAFVLSRFSVKQLLASNDFYLNDLNVPQGPSGWWWDKSPANEELLRTVGEVKAGYRASQATYTCIGKAAARMIIEEARAAMNPDVSHLEQNQQ